MQKIIRFGIIGCSRIAYSSVIPAIIDSQHAQLVMIGSRDPKKAEKFAKKFNCKKYGRYEDVLSDEEIDAVYISTPVGLHEEWTIKAARAGKHILCEKSSTTSYSSATKMVYAAKQNKVRLMEGLMFRFHPSHEKVLEIIRGAMIGKIFSFYGRYGFQAIPKTDIRYNKKLGGGVLNDAVCYPICASRMIFDREPTSVACSLHMDKKTGVDEHAIVTLKYGSEQFAQMVVGYGLFYQSMYSVWGTKGFLKLSRSYNIPPDMPASLILNSNKENKELIIKPTNHFLLMVDGFCKEILRIKPAFFDFERDLLRQAKVMQATRIANDKNRFVEISEIN